MPRSITIFLRWIWIARSKAGESRLYSSSVCVLLLLGRFFILSGCWRDHMSQKKEIRADTQWVGERMKYTVPQQSTIQVQIRRIKLMEAWPTRLFNLSKAGPARGKDW